MIIIMRKKRDCRTKTGHFNKKFVVNFIFNRTEWETVGLGVVSNVIFFFLPGREVMLIWWIRTNAAHSVICLLPQRWWLTHITKAKSMPKG